MSVDVFTMMPHTMNLSAPDVLYFLGSKMVTCRSDKTPQCRRHKSIRAMNENGRDVSLITL